MTTTGVHDHGTDVTAPGDLPRRPVIGAAVPAVRP